MARFTIPNNAGKFCYSKHWSGKGYFLVMNDKTGKNSVIIAVATEADARELCRKLNSGDHQGVVSAPELKR
jgi:hypothetical protein